VGVVAHLLGTYVGKGRFAKGLDFHHHAARGPFKEIDPLGYAVPSANAEVFTSR